MIQWLDEALNKASDIKIKVNKWLDVYGAISFLAISLGLFFGAAILQGRKEQAQLQAETQAKKHNNPVVSVQSDLQSNLPSETYKPTDSYGMSWRYEASVRELNKRRDEERAQEERDERRRKEADEKEVRNRDYNHHTYGAGWIN